MAATTATERRRINDAHDQLQELLHLIEAYQNLGEASDDPTLSGFDVAQLMRTLSDRVHPILEVLD